MNAPDYQERVKKRVLSQRQPEIQAYEVTEDTENHRELENIESSLSRWVWVVGILLMAVIGFSMVEAYLTVVNLFQTNVVLGGFLSFLLIVAMFAFSYLIGREWLGIKQLKSISSSSLSLDELKGKGDRETAMKAINVRARSLASMTPAYALHRTFFQTIKPHHTNDEVLQIYGEKVQKPLLEKARKVLKQESIGAGAVAFISPNSLLQTFGILWISMRTLKKIAYVYGIRPSLIGNLKLFRVALENLAASSFTDLVTDELANQLGGTIGDKVIANSADAITAASLNQRLGRALIKELTNSSTKVE